MLRTTKLASIGARQGVRGFRATAMSVSSSSGGQLIR